MNNGATSASHALGRNRWDGCFFSSLCSRKWNCICFYLLLSSLPFAYQQKEPFPFCIPSSMQCRLLAANAAKDVLFVFVSSFPPFVLPLSSCLYWELTLICSGLYCDASTMSLAFFFFLLLTDNLSLTLLIKSHVKRYRLSCFRLLTAPQSAFLFCLYSLCSVPPSTCLLSLSLSLRPPPTFPLGHALLCLPVLACFFFTEQIFDMLRAWLGEDGIFVLPHSSLSPREHDKWLNQRKIAVKLFKQSNFRTLMMDAFVEKGKELVEHLQTRPRGPVDMQSKFFAFTMDSIMKVT